MDDREQLIECQREAEKWLTDQLDRPLWNEAARSQLEQLALWRGQRARQLEAVTDVDPAREWDLESERVALEQAVVSGLIKEVVDGFVRQIRNRELD